VGRKVCVRQEQLIYCEGWEEDVLAVYIVGDCMMTCKVGFLPQHLAVRANVYAFWAERVLLAKTVLKSQAFLMRHRRKTRIPFPCHSSTKDTSSSM
jgi:hypothetical protein